MLKRFLESASLTVKPVARRVVTPLLDSSVGDGVGSLRVAKRFAKQWAASAGLYESEAPASNLAPEPSASRPAAFVVDAASQLPVRLYTTRKHSSCKTAKRILEDLGVVYEEIDLSDDPAAREKLYEETRDRTFPQIFIDGARLGGFDDLVVAKEEGRLFALLQPSARP